MGGRRATAVLLVAFALILAGCGLLPRAHGISSAGCSNIASAGACSEQIDRIAARHPGASQVDITCGCSGACTPTRGEAEVTVSFSDGSQEGSGVGWEGALP